jgi:hypothetical protein
MSTPSEPHERAADDFVPTEELIRRQEGRPFRSLEELPGQDPFGSEEEYQEFLADLYASRRAGG